MKYSKFQTHNLLSNLLFTLVTLPYPLPFLFCDKDAKNVNVTGGGCLKTAPVPSPRHPALSLYPVNAKERNGVKEVGSAGWSWQGKVLWRGDPFPSPRYPTLSLYSVSAEGAKQGWWGRVDGVRLVGAES